MPDLRYDIILTTFNRLEYTKDTVASLISSGAVAKAERFIIVDNRSTEKGFKEFLDDLYDYAGNIFIIRRDKNDGWGMAVNDALGISRAPYLLISNNDVVFNLGFMDTLKDTMLRVPNIGILGVWRHTSHSFVRNGVQNEWFREMDNVPAVGWFIPKNAMEKVGMLPEHGPCFTKGGNGEDTAYVNRMRDAGFLVGVCKEDIAKHVDGY